MGLGAFYTCIKYLMFAFNFLFWLMGCAILGVGIWVRVDKNFQQYVHNSDSFNYLYTGAYVLIGVGIVMMIIGFLGCCGAIRESQCMLATFFVFLLVIFGILIAAGAWVVIAKDSQLKDAVDSTLRKSVDGFRRNDEAAMKFMKAVQDTFKCCGVQGLGDYKDQAHQSGCDQHFDQGCSDKVYDYFEQHLVVIAGVAIGVGVVMVMGMSFAMCLCCAIRRDLNREEYEKVRTRDVRRC